MDENADEMDSEAQLNFRDGDEEEEEVSSLPFYLN